MHFMLETIISAELFGVDPYNQPSVEYGKNLTKEYLTGLRNMKSHVPIPRAKVGVVKEKGN